MEKLSNEDEDYVVEGAIKYWGEKILELLDEMEAVSIINASIVNKIREKFMIEKEKFMTEDQKIENWEIKKYLNNFWKSKK